jgi:hypothetical protein
MEPEGPLLHPWSSQLDPVLSQMKPIHTLSPHFRKIHVNILLCNRWSNVVDVYKNISIFSVYSPSSLVPQYPGVQCVGIPPFLSSDVCAALRCYLWTPLLGTDCSMLRSARSRNTGVSLCSCHIKTGALFWNSWRSIVLLKQIYNIF